MRIDGSYSDIRVVCEDIFVYGRRRTFRWRRRHVYVFAFRGRFEVLVDAFRLVNLRGDDFVCFVVCWRGRRQRRAVRVAHSDEIDRIIYVTRRFLEEEERDLM